MPYVITKYGELLKRLKARAAMDSSNIKKIFIKDHSINKQI